jgi:hypothetical protein
VSANFTAVSLGSETNGSIVCPANVSGVAPERRAPDRDFSERDEGQEVHHL